MTKALFGQFAGSVPAFAVAIGAVLGAWAWVQLGVVVTLVGFVFLLFVGGMSYKIGDVYLDRDRPAAVQSQRFLRLALAAPAALAILVGAGLIVLGVETVPEKGWSEERKQLTAAAAAAVSTFLTAAFIKGADDADEGWVGKMVKDRFSARFENRFPVTATKPRDAAFSLTRGWDVSERKKRAQEIDDYLEAGGETLPRAQ